MAGARTGNVAFWGTLYHSNSNHSVSLSLSFFHTHTHRIYSPPRLFTCVSRPYTLAAATTISAVRVRCNIICTYRIYVQCKTNDSRNRIAHKHRILGTRRDMARRRFLSLDEGSRPRSPERVLSRRGDLQGCAQPLSCPFFPLLPMYIFLPHEGCGVNDIFSSAFRKSYTYIIYTIRGSTIHHLKTANYIMRQPNDRSRRIYTLIKTPSCRTEHGE